MQLKPNRLVFETTTSLQVPPFWHLKELLEQNNGITGHTLQPKDIFFFHLLKLKFK
jgi:hypothetical protein